MALLQIHSLGQWRGAREQAGGGGGGAPNGEDSEGSFISIKTSASSAYARGGSGVERASGQRGRSLEM